MMAQQSMDNIFMLKYVNWKPLSSMYFVIYTSQLTSSSLDRSETRYMRYEPTILWVNMNGVIRKYYVER